MRESIHVYRRQIYIPTHRLCPVELPACLHLQKCPTPHCCHLDSFSKLCPDTRPPGFRACKQVGLFLPRTQDINIVSTETKQTLSFSAATWALILVKTCKKSKWNTHTHSQEITKYNRFQVGVLHQMYLCIDVECLQKSNILPPPAAFP